MMTPTSRCIISLGYGAYRWDEGLGSCAPSRYFGHAWALERLSAIVDNYMPWIELVDIMQMIRRSRRRSLEGD